MFGLVLCFTLFNIVVFLGIQRRYKNWLITVFYVFSVIVLVMRMMQYIYLLKFYGEIQDIEQTWNDLSGREKIDFIKYFRD